MGQFTHNGVIYEELPDGNVRVVGYDAQMPADPSFQYEGPKAAADAQRAGNQAAASAYDPALAEAELRRREIEARERELKLAEAQSTREQEAEMAGTKDLRQRLRTGNILESVRNARILAQKGGTGFSSLASPIPMTAARELDAALAPIRASLAFERLQEMRDESKTGGALGQVSERELDLLMGAVASLDTGVSMDAFLDNLEKVERHFVGSQLALSGVDPASNEGKEVFRDYGVSFDAQGKGGGSEDYQVGISERYATDTDKKVAKVLQAAFDRGAGADELNAIVRQYGYPNLNMKEIGTAIQYRDSGGKGVKVNVPQSGYSDPSIADRAMQSVAAGPVGGYFGQAANALTFGGLDELQGVAGGDTLGEAFSGTGRATAEADLKKNLQAQANPLSALLGNISGGAIGALGTGALAGAGRVAATTFAPRALAGDALYGSAYGAGESNDSRLGGAALGAVAGAGGGALGRGAARRIGDAVGGVGGPGQYLREQGVRMTPGQIGESMNQATPGGSGLGRFLKRREDRLAGYSGIGDAIGRQQETGLRQFNQAGFRQGLGVADAIPPEIAEEGIDQAGDLVSQAYGRALDGQNFVADQQFTRGIGTALNRARGLPAIGDEAAYSLEQSVAPFVDPAGNIPGRNMQSITQELGRRASRFDNSQSAVGPDAANVLRGALDDVGGMVERQAPGVMDDFSNANTGYRNLKILEDAVGRAMNTDGVFTPAQLGMAARGNAKKFGGRYASQDRPFFELQRAGQQILPGKVPDSGTAGRQAAGDGITGAIKAAARSLRLPLYSDPVVESLNTIAFARPDIARALGEQARRAARPTGLFGAPLGVYATSN